MSAPRIACLTLANPAGFVIDDHIAFAEMRRRGWRVDVRAWCQPTRWADYDRVIIRTPWDYQHHADAFLRVLEDIEAAGAGLRNPASVVRWNLRKTYLRDLAAAGVATIPTHWHDQPPNAEDIQAAMAAFDTDALIIKPVVGANADHTYRVDTANWASVAPKLAGVGHPLMLQPFLADVLAAGEVSLFVFGGVLSHAIRKVPAAGDFRVQEEHGGAITPYVPDPALRAAAEHAMAAAPGHLLYGRADFITDNQGTWRLIELELIEPSLYFRMHPHAAMHFADAVAADLASLPVPRPIGTGSRR